MKRSIALALSLLALAAAVPAGAITPHVRCATSTECF